MGCSRSQLVGSREALHTCSRLPQQPPHPEKGAPRHRTVGSAADKGDSHLVQPGLRRKSRVPWGCTQRVRVVFIRHAQALPTGQRVGGHVQDPPLSKRGAEQATAVADRLRDDIDSANVVCSPMRRCLLTAEPLVTGSRLTNGQIVVCNALFCEHNNDPAAFDPGQIASEFPTVFGKDVGHAVSFLGFQRAADHNPMTTPQRSTMAAEWLRHFVREHGEKVSATLVFCHQTFLDCLLRLIWEGTTERWKYADTAWKFANTGITEIVVDPDDMLRVERKNDNAHAS